MSGINELRRRKEREGSNYSENRPSQNIIYHGDYSAQKFVMISLMQVLYGVGYFAAVYVALHIPQLREYTLPLIHISHVLPSGEGYPGYKDASFVLSCIVFVILARALVQLALFLCVWKNKNLQQRTKIRFTEQGWCAIYYALSSCYGLYLMYLSPYSFRASSLWEGYPHYFIPSYIKQYYLFILGFWISQIFIIHLEDKRSDHYQMLTHHIVTSLLVWGSYMYCYTRIGHLIMLMMDGVDAFLAAAKCLKYLDVLLYLNYFIFGCFLVSWIVCRHFIYVYELVYSQFNALKLVEGRCAYFPGLEHEGPVACFSRTAHVTCFVLTMILQVIMIWWLVLILRVVVKLIRGEDANDNRSDTEMDPTDTNDEDDYEKKEF